MKEDEYRVKIAELLEIMKENDLDALKVKIGDETFELVRRGTAPSHATAAFAVPPDPAAGAPSVTAKRITAPVVGVFYRSSAPGADPFVNVGDRVQEGDVVCILEAMKMMNEITSDYSGVVSRILPENGELVSLGEELFWIEP